MTPADLRALADRRYEAAIAEGHEQMANGWKPNEIVAVLEDALGPIESLHEQADEAEAAAAYMAMLERARKRTARLRRFGSLRRAS